MFSFGIDFLEGFPPLSLSLLDMILLAFNFISNLNWIEDNVRKELHIEISTFTS